MTITFRAKRKKLVKAIKLSHIAYTGLLAGNLLTGLAWAGPEGGEVVDGEATITQEEAETIINQATENLTVDWDTFNIDADERVEFIQPSSSSVALNRILDQSPSEIRGNITANGHVVLVNPNGVLFTETSTVNVGAISAAGLDVSVDDFITKGELNFAGKDGAQGYVINRGTISASSAALVGKHVANSGYIKADMISLKAGQEAIVTFDTDGMLGVEITKELLENAGYESAVLNTGNLEAKTVMMEAKVSSALFTSAVNNSGVVKAAGIDTSGGKIRLFGGGSSVVNTGTLDASATGENADAGNITLESDNITYNAGEIYANSEQGTGGDIHVLGETVTVDGTISATGAIKGGEVLIGGDYQGKNDAIQNAKTTTLEATATIDASGEGQGDGGKVIVWSDGETYFYGFIDASSGLLGGDGGLIETSGKNIVIQGDVLAAGSSTGKPGVWLIDPETLTISSDDACSASPDNCMKASVITNALQNGMGVTVKVEGSSLSAIDSNTNGLEIGSNDGSGAGNIIVASTIKPETDNLTRPTLTLDASGDITINPGVSIDGDNQTGLNIELIADGEISLETNDDDGNAKIFTDGGTLTTTSQQFVNNGQIGTIVIDTSVSEWEQKIGDVTINVGQERDSDGNFTTNVSSNNILGWIEADVITVNGNGTDTFTFNESETFKLNAANQVVIDENGVAKYTSTGGFVRNYDRTITLNNPETINAAADSSLTSDINLDLLAGNTVKAGNVEFNGLSAVSGMTQNITITDYQATNWGLIWDTDGSTTVLTQNVINANDKILFSKISRIDTGIDDNSETLTGGVLASPTLNVDNIELSFALHNSSNHIQANAAGINFVGLSNISAAESLTLGDDNLIDTNYLYTDLIDSSKNKIILEDGTGNNRTLEFSNINLISGSRKLKIAFGKTFDIKNVNSDESIDSEGTIDGISFTGLDSVEAKLDDNNATSKVTATDREWVVSDGDNSGEYKVSSAGISFTGFKTFEDTSLSSTLTTSTAGKDEFTITAEDAVEIAGYEFAGVDTVTSDSNVTTDSLAAASISLTGIDKQVDYNGKSRTITFSNIDTISADVLTGSASDDTFVQNAANEFTANAITFSEVTTINAGDNSSGGDTLTANFSGTAVNLMGNGNTQKNGVNLVTGTGNVTVAVNGIENITTINTISGSATASDEVTDATIDATNSNNTVTANGITFTTNKTSINLGSDTDDTVSGQAALVLTGNLNQITVNGFTVSGVDSASGATLTASSEADSVTEAAIGTDSGPSTFTINGIALSQSGSTFDLGGGNDIVSIDSTTLAGGENSLIAGGVTFSSVEQATSKIITGSASDDAFVQTGATSFTANSISFSGVNSIAAGNHANINDTLTVLTTVNLAGNDKQNEITLGDNNEVSVTGIDTISSSSNTIKGSDALADVVTAVATGSNGDPNTFTINGIAFSSTLTELDLGNSDTNNPSDIVQISTATLAGGDKKLLANGITFGSVEQSTANSITGSTLADIFVQTGATSFTANSISFSGVNSIAAGNDANINDTLTVSTTVNLAGNDKQNEITLGDNKEVSVTGIDTIYSSSNTIKGSDTLADVVTAAATGSNGSPNTFTINGIAFSSSLTEVDLGNSGTSNPNDRVELAAVTLTDNNNELVASGITFSAVEEATAASITGSSLADAFIQNSANSFTANSISFSGVNSIAAGNHANINDTLTVLTTVNLAGNDKQNEITLGDNNEVSVTGIDSIYSLNNAIKGSDTLADVVTAAATGSNGAPNTFKINGIEFSSTLTEIDLGNSGTSNPNDRVELAAVTLTDNNNELVASGITFSAVEEATAASITGSSLADAFIQNSANSFTANSISFSGVNSIAAGNHANINDTLTVLTTVNLAGNDKQNEITLGDNNEVSVTGIDTISSSSNTIKGSDALADVVTAVATGSNGDPNTFTINGIAFSSTLTELDLGNSDTNNPSDIVQISTATLAGGDKKLLANGITFGSVEQSTANSITGSTLADIFVQTGATSFTANSISFSGVNSIAAGNDANINDTLTVSTTVNLAGNDKQNEITLGDNKEVSVTGIDTIYSSSNTIKGSDTLADVVTAAATGSNGSPNTFTINGIAFSSSLTEVDLGNSGTSNPNDRVELAAVTLTDNNNELVASGITFSAVEEATAASITGSSLADAFIQNSANSFTANSISFSGVNSIAAGNHANINDTLTVLTTVNLAGNDKQNEITLGDNNEVSVTGIDTISSSSNTIKGSDALADVVTAVATGSNGDPNTFTINGIAFSSTLTELDLGNSDTNNPSDIVQISTATLAGGDKKLLANGITFGSVEQSTANSITGSTLADIFVQTGATSFTANSISFSGVNSIAAGNDANINDTLTVSTTVNLAGNDKQNEITLGDNKEVSVTGIDTIYSSSNTIKGSDTLADVVTAAATGSNGSPNTFTINGIAFSSSLTEVDLGNSDTNNPNDIVQISTATLAGGDKKLLANGITFGSVEQSTANSITGSTLADIFVQTGATSFTANSISFSGVNSIAAGNDANDTLTVSTTVNLAGNDKQNEITLGDNNEVSVTGIDSIYSLNNAIRGNDTLADVVTAAATGSNGAPNTFQINGIEFSSTLTQIDLGNSVGDALNINAASLTLSGDKNVQNANGITFSGVEIAQTAEIIGTDQSETFEQTGANAFLANAITFTGVTSIKAGKNADATAQDSLTAISDIYLVKNSSNVSINNELILGNNSVSVTGIESVTASTLTATDVSDTFTYSNDELLANGITFTSLTNVNFGGGTDKIIDGEGITWNLTGTLNALRTNKNVLFTGLEELAVVSSSLNAKVIGTDNSESSNTLGDVNRNVVFEVDQTDSTRILFDFGGIQFENITQLDTGGGTDAIDGIRDGAWELNYSSTDGYSVKHQGVTITNAERFLDTLALTGSDSADEFTVGTVGDDSTYNYTYKNRTNEAYTLAVGSSDSSMLFYNLTSVNGGESSDTVNGLDNAAWEIDYVKETAADDSDYTTLVVDRNIAFTNNSSEPNDGDVRSANEHAISINFYDIELFSSEESTLKSIHNDLPKTPIPNTVYRAFETFYAIDPSTIRISNNVGKTTFNNIKATNSVYGGAAEDELKYAPEFKSKVRNKYQPNSYVEITPSPKGDNTTIFEFYEVLTYAEGTDIYFDEDNTVKFTSSGITIDGIGIKASDFSGALNTAGASTTNTVIDLVGDMSWSLNGDGVNGLANQVSTTYTLGEINYDFTLTGVNYLKLGENSTFSASEYSDTFSFIQDSETNITSLVANKIVVTVPTDFEQITSINALGGIDSVINVDAPNWTLLENNNVEYILSNGNKFTFINTEVFTANIPTADTAGATVISIADDSFAREFEVNESGAVSLVATDTETNLRINQNREFNNVATLNTDADDKVFIDTAVLAGENTIRTGITEITNLFAAYKNSADDSSRFIISGTDNDDTVSIANEKQITANKINFYNVDEVDLGNNITSGDIVQGTNSQAWELNGTTDSYTITASGIDFNKIEKFTTADNAITSALNVNTNAQTISVTALNELSFGTSVFQNITSLNDLTKSNALDVIAGSDVAIVNATEFTTSAITATNFNSVIGGNINFTSASDALTFSLSEDGKTVVDANTIDFSIIAPSRINTGSGTGTDTVTSTETSAAGFTTWVLDTFKVNDTDINGVNYGGVELVNAQQYSGVGISLTGTDGIDEFVVSKAGNANATTNINGLSFADITQVFALDGADTILVDAGSNVALTGTNNQAINQGITFTDIVSASGGQAVGSDLTDTVTITGSQAFTANGIAFTNQTSLDLKNQADGEQDTVNGGTSWQLAIDSSTTNYNATSNGITFTNLEKVATSEATITGTDAIDEFNIDGDNALTAKNIAFTGINAVIGKLGKDVVNALNTNTVELTGDNYAATTNKIAFTEIETVTNGQLQGGDGDDTIVLSAARAFTANLIEFSNQSSVALGGGKDTVDSSALTATPWQIDGNFNATVGLADANIRFTELEVVTANGSTLTGLTSGTHTINADATDLSLNNIDFTGIANFDGNEVYTLNVADDYALSLTGESQQIKDATTLFSEITKVTGGAIKGSAQVDNLVFDNATTLRANNIFIDLPASGAIDLNATTTDTALDTVTGANNASWQLTANNNEIEAYGITISGADTLFGTNGTLVGTQANENFVETVSNTIEIGKMAFNDIVSISAGDAAANSTDTDIYTAQADTSLVLTGNNNEVTIGSRNVSGIEQVAGGTTPTGSSSADHAIVNVTETAVTFSINDVVFDTPNSTPNSTAIINLGGGNNTVTGINANGWQWQLIGTDTSTDNMVMDVANNIQFNNVAFANSNGVNNAVLTTRETNDFIESLSANKVGAAGIVFSDITTVHAVGGTNTLSTEVGEFTNNESEFFANEVTFTSIHDITGLDITKLDYSKVFVVGDKLISINGVEQKQDSLDLTGKTVEITGFDGEKWVVGNNANSATNFNVTFFSDATPDEMFTAIAINAGLEGTSNNDIFVEGDGFVSSNGFKFVGINSLNGLGGTDTFTALATSNIQLTNSDFTVIIDDLNTTNATLTVAGIEKIENGHLFGSIATAQSDGADSIAFIDTTPNNVILRAKQIEFTGFDSTVNLGTGNDTVTSLDGAQWTLDGANQATSEGVTFTNVEMVTANNSTLTDTTGEQRFEETATNIITTGNISFTGLATLNTDSGADAFTALSQSTLELNGEKNQLKLNDSILITGVESAFGGQLSGGNASDHIEITGIESIKANDITFTNRSSVNLGDGDGIDTIAGLATTENVQNNWELDNDGNAVATSSNIVFEGAEQITATGATLDTSAKIRNFEIVGDNAVTVANTTFKEIVNVTASSEATDSVSALDGGKVELTDKNNKITSAGITFDGIDKVTGGALTASDSSDTIVLSKTNDVVTLTANKIDFAAPNSLDLAGGTDEVTGLDGINWQILSANSASNGDITFTNVETLVATGAGIVGTDASDQFTVMANGNINVATIDTTVDANGTVSDTSINVMGASSIDAAAGTDRIIANDTNATWALSGAAYAAALTSNGLPDVLAVTNIEAVSGGRTILAGSTGDDSFQLDSSNLLTANSIVFADISTVNANTGTNSVTGETGATWLLENGGNSASSQGVLFNQLTNVESSNIVINAKDAILDTFTANGAEVTTRDIVFSNVSSVDAGTNNNDTLNDLDNSNWILQGNNSLNNGFTTFTGIDTVKANTNASLTGLAGDEDYALTSNANELSTAGILFQGLNLISGNGGTNNLIGTSDNENFTLASNGDVTTAGMAFNGISQVKAGGGTDTVQSNGASWTNLVENTAIVDGAAIANLESISVIFTDIETVQNTGTFTGQNIATTYSLNGTDSITVSGIEYNGLQQLVAGTALDTLKGPELLESTWLLEATQGSITLADGTFAFTGIDSIKSGSQKDVITITGGNWQTIETNGGNDIVNLGGNVATVDLGDGNDQLFATTNPATTTVLIGGADNDTLTSELVETWAINNDVNGDNTQGNLVFNGFETLQNKSDALDVVTTSNALFANGGALNLANNGIQMSYNPEGDVTLNTSATGTAISGNIDAANVDFVSAGNIDLTSNITQIKITSARDATNESNINVEILEINDLTIDIVDAGTGDIYIGSSALGGDLSFVKENASITALRGGDVNLGNESTRWRTVADEFTFYNVEADKFSVYALNYTPANSVTGNTVGKPQIIYDGFEIPNASEIAREGAKSAQQDQTNEMVQIDPAVFEAVSPYSIGVGAVNSPEMRLVAGVLLPMEATAAGETGNPNNYEGEPSNSSEQGADDDSASVVPYAPPADSLAAQDVVPQSEPLTLVYDEEPAVTVAAKRPTLSQDYPENYSVEQGDTLWDIAKKFLNNPLQWTELWENNPQIENPDLIYPGDVIRIIIQKGKGFLTIEKGAGNDSNKTPLDNRELNKDYALNSRNKLDTKG